MGLLDTRFASGAQKCSGWGEFRGLNLLPEALYGQLECGGSCGIKAVPTDGVGRGRESDPGSARVYGVMDDLRSVAGGMVAGVLGVAQESGTRSRRKLKGRFLALLRSLSIPEL